SIVSVVRPHAARARRTAARAVQGAVAVGSRYSTARTCPAPRSVYRKRGICTRLSSSDTSRRRCPTPLPRRRPSTPASLPPASMALLLRGAVALQPGLGVLALGHRRLALRVGVQLVGGEPGRYVPVELRRPLMRSCRPLVGEPTAFTVPVHSVAHGTSVPR